ncbi:MAG: paraquat-inducible protein A [Verrucomicrobiota bacterium]
MTPSDRHRFEAVKALAITGAFLYLPSNMIPVMTMTVNGDVEPLTVMGGAMEMYCSGLWPVAVIIFLASVVVPLLKLLVTAWLLWFHGSTQWQRERSIIRHIMIKIGSWAMIDIFLLSVIAAVGQLGTLASVHAEPGALFFAAVLLCNIFSYELCKTSWIWEAAKE